MSLTLKRELLFWLVTAAVIGLYVPLGHRIAPSVPPEPQPSSSPGNVISQAALIDRFKKDEQARRDWKRTLNAHNSFLRSWYRWGAGIGIVLVLAYTCWRPPWRVVGSSEQERESNLPAHQRPVRRMLAEHRHLLLGVVAVLLLVALAVVTVALLSTL